jgi:signal transduction histidine kinase
VDGAKDSSGILEAFFRNSPDPIIFLNNQGEILEQNARASQFWSIKDLPGLLPRIFMDDVHKVARSGKPIHRRFKDEMIPLQCHDRVRYFLPSLFTISQVSNPAEGDGSGRETETPLIVAILRDETAWELSIRIRNNLLSSISHELNTPLTSARLSLYLLHEEKIGPLNETQRELVTSAKDDLDREILSIRELLDLIKKEGRLEAEGQAEKLLLDQLVRDALADLEESLRKKELELSGNIAEDLPLVRLDPETARTIIYQVLSLTIKESNLKDRIRIDAFRDDGQSVLQIENLGGDDSLEQLPDDLFTYPLESPVIRSLGTQPLGLRLVHEMVESKGGSLHFKNTVQGRSLILEMPID